MALLLWRYRCCVVAVAIQRRILYALLGSHLRYMFIGYKAYPVKHFRLNLAKFNDFEHYSSVPLRCRISHPARDAVFVNLFHYRVGGEDFGYPGRKNR